MKHVLVVLHIDIGFIPCFFDRIRVPKLKFSMVYVYLFGLQGKVERRRKTSVMNRGRMGSRYRPVEQYNLGRICLAEMQC